MLNKHPYADAIIKRLQEFKDLTGIDVETSETPGENYFDKLTAALEAIALADRIAVMNEGKLQQFDTPLEVFNHPAN